jgi:hypothetical protein
MPSQVERQGLAGGDAVDEQQRPQQHRGNGVKSPSHTSQPEGPPSEALQWPQLKRLIVKLPTKQVGAE